MFEELEFPERRRWRKALLLSFAVHCLVLLALARRPSPAFVHPAEVALGTPYSSGSVIYLAPLGPEQAHETETAALTKPARLSASKPASKPIARHREEASKTVAEAPEVTAHGGSPYGSHIPGTPLTGPAVMPALPQVFPDPPISRGDLPPGVEGDVIVEVTIDERGNVTDLKLTQGIGYGIDEKVLAILRQWHFRPATRDGVTIASQHLVHFHYPS